MKWFRGGWALMLVVCVAGSVLAKEKEKEPAGKNVDSGSFGIFVKGRRAGTETFSITQNANGSVTNAEFKAEGAAGQAVQKSELQLAGNGDIRRYEWKEESPITAQSVVIPNDEFLTQKWSGAGDDKERENPYLLPHSTSILDDYFFVHRELLAWKYLGGACTHEKEGLRCPKAQFGTLNPSQHASSPASMQYLGRDKVKIHDVERELNKLELKSETGDWLIWLDDDFKVQLISIPSENTEVIRD